MLKFARMSSQYCDSSLLYSPIEIGCYSVHLGGDQEQCGTKTVSCLDFKLHSRFFHPKSDAVTSWLLIALKKMAACSFANDMCTFFPWL